MGNQTPLIRCGEKGRRSRWHSKRRAKGHEARIVRFLYAYMHGLKKEPRRGEPHRLREVEEARSRRWEKVVRADCRANSIVKKVRETIEAR